MKRIRHHRQQATLNLPTLQLEGSLFLPDQLEKAAQGRAQDQADTDYGIPKGVKLKDEYSRAFQIACAQWQHFAAQSERADVDDHALTQSYVAELLRDALGYAAAQSTATVQAGAFAYPVSFMAGPATASVPVLVAPHSLALDEADPRFAVAGSGSRKKSAFQAMQELLNASPDHTWGIVSNGRQLRLLRDAASLTRPAYLECDLADLLGGQRYAEFANIWRLLHASRAPHTGGACIWERWREAGKAEGTRVRDGLRHGVEQALLTFGEGFLQHPANDALRAALHEGQLSQDAYFQQLLRLIYRLIFVFTVEERGVLHPQDDSADALAARKAYAEGYALARLRQLCLKRRARNRFDDHWQAIRIVWRGLAQGEPRLALPALGGLFVPSQCPHLDAASLHNTHLLAALQHLRWAVTTQGKASSLTPIDYRNMGPEELGSVYESLLELVPTIDLPARRFGFVGLTEEGSTAGNARKLTGSYYTPDSLVQQLIHSALDPVIAQRLAANPAQPVEALLSIRVIDPACGSGHFLLAAARRLAEKLAQLRAPEGAVTPQAYRHALREVVGRCIFGVDRNPMAIELARTALWLEGFEEGRPLGFLDHHLQCGDALLGLTNLEALKQGIAKDAFKPLSGDDKEVCKQLAKRNSAGLKQLAKDVQSGQHLLAFAADTGLQALQALEALGADTAEDVAAQERAYYQICEQLAHSPLALAADLAISAYLLPKTPDTAAQVPTSETLHTALTAPQLLADPGADQSATVAAARAACQQARVLHWPLAFPQVYAAGGFDCVLGNPPWERIKLQEEEFFATRHPAVAAAQNKAERTRYINALSQGQLAHLLASAGTGTPLPEGGSAAEKRLYAEFIAARRVAEATSVFMHVDGSDGGRYPLTGVGDVNTYALFAETILQITAPTGRAGFIVPTGIATDDSTKAYFGHITQSGRLVSLYDIENRDALFASVHRSFKFCLLTLGQAEAAEFVCYAGQVVQLADPRRRFTLTPDEFRLINPNTLTCPVFRSSADAALTKKLYNAAPVLIREAVWAGEGKQAKLVEPEANPWGISFSTMFHMSNDSGLFLNAPAEGRLPLYEAKLIRQFDHRWATYTPDGDSRDLLLGEKQDPATTVTPRYWVQAREVWLRVARLPQGLHKALKDGNPDATVLCATQLLFGWWLQEARRRDPAVGTYTAWQAFVRQHPYASEVAPVSLGLCGNNPASIQPLNDNYLPAEGAVEVFMSNERHGTAWYAVDAQAEQTVLDFTADHRHLPAPSGPLHDRDAVLALAERWLQAACPQWLMGWRDICRATDERTVIASVVPLAGVGHTMPLFFTSQTAAHNAALLGNLGALVLDFCARVKVGGTHLTYGYLKQFPVLPPDRYTEADLAYIVPRVLELTYTAHDLAGWAKDLGYNGPPFAFNPERRAALRAELDTYYARLYGLTHDEQRYILDPAAVMGEDYPSETFRALKNKELREYGEYRTQRLVLEAWKALEAQLPVTIPAPRPARRTTPLPIYAQGGTPASEAEDWLAGVVCDVLLQAGQCDDNRLRRIVLAPLPKSTPFIEALPSWLAPVNTERWAHIRGWLHGLLGVPVTAPLSIRNPEALANVIGDHRTQSLAAALIQAHDQQEAALKEVLAGAASVVQSNELRKQG
ncbi:N-6 DNA methylase [Diaphorobacter sp. MNS-0]|uniref:Eco57I restriction-modification methylase domain-containing protein n=1 Tax=Diaphorobacter sp. MNS-0 TaxID=2866628 RepID=UPI001C737E99|nr:N-6 DNA methylase [Diaphorobacter sp. MNS-0]QYY26412.1 N-6 DNA methylase [Diaphorobacter sp. MNS-0]